MKNLTLFVELTKKISSFNVFFNKEVEAMYFQSTVEPKLILHIATTVIENITRLENHGDLISLRDLHEDAFDEVINLLNNEKLLKIFYAYINNLLGPEEFSNKLFINGVKFF